jgi:hypothetical protein
MTTDAAPGQPGTAPSPFDPNPPDTNDPFSSTGPWAGPPETWQDLASTDHGRQKARLLGAAARQVRRLRALPTPMVAAWASLREHPPAGSEPHRARPGPAHALIARMQASGTRLCKTLQCLLQQGTFTIVNDLASTPLALVASVALDNVTQAA